MLFLRITSKITQQIVHASKLRLDCDTLENFDAPGGQNYLGGFSGSHNPRNQSKSLLSRNGTNFIRIISQQIVKGISHITFQLFLPVFSPLLLR